MTKADYILTKRRMAYKQTRIMSAFRSRSQIAGGGKGFILNTEELASVWHFPTEEIKAPQLKRSDARAVEPPTSLPVESQFGLAESLPTVTVAAEPRSRNEEEAPAELELEPDADKPKVTLDKAAMAPGQKTDKSGSESMSSPPENLPF
jgi:hypothetical protein